MHDLAFSAVKWQLPRSRPGCQGVKIPLEYISVGTVLDWSEYLGVVCIDQNWAINIHGHRLHCRNEQNGSQDTTLRYTTFDLYPVRRSSLKHNSLFSASEKSSNPVQQHASNTKRVKGNQQPFMCNRIEGFFEV